MRPTLTRTLFLLLFFSSLVAAANFTKCLENFSQEPDGTVGGVDLRGNPTTPAKAVGLTYETCTARCGESAEKFNWNAFAQLFSTWLLPWLALISQLPFGFDVSDNFISVCLSVGSPALAAYSLALTSLNVRLVYRRVRTIKHDSKYDVARALVSLQQTPLQLTRDDRLLALISATDSWRREISDRLSWSVTVGSSIAWVVVSFVFTLVDSFVSLDNSTGAASQGHAVGTLWLWLLCLVIGWLWVPAFTIHELRNAIGHANRRTAKKAAKKVKLEAGKAYKSAKANITHMLPKRILEGPMKFTVESAPDVNEGNEKAKVDDTKPTGEGADTELDPLPNLTQNQPTIPPQTYGGSQHDHLSPSAIQTANHSTASLAHSAPVHSIAAQSSIHPETHRLFVPMDGSHPLNRDEVRLSATFNYSRIIRYFVLVDDVLKALDELAHERDLKKRKSDVPEIAAKPAVFPPGVFLSMLNASFFAIFLQCGTTAAAILIIIYTPTVGLGCRSLGYLIYGGTAIFILFITIISTIFARLSETRNETSKAVKWITAFIAISLRRIALLLAFINATGLIVLSCFQFSHFLDNCYCNASVIGRGTDSFVLVTYEGWISTMRIARIAATALSGATVVVYMTLIWRMSSVPKDLEYL